MAALLFVTLALAGCDGARLADVAPDVVGRVNLSGLGAVEVAGARAPQPILREPPRPAELPPEQTSRAFEFLPEGAGEDGILFYRVRIGPGGNPALVALARLTPLFNVDGKDAITYVSDAYFAAHPHRNPSSIQPGDEFLLQLPAGTFVVRWQSDGEQHFGHPARLREYVSEQGDRLRYYLSDPFPLRYETESASEPGRGILQFSPDLAFLLGSGQTDAFRLAQLVFRVHSPDIYQVETMRRFVARVQPGEVLTLEVDRSRTHMDPIREALLFAQEQERVTEPERDHLTRYFMPDEERFPLVAFEDALSSRPTVGELADGQVFRIEYYRDGVVRVFYKTGAEDAKGRRDPYALREERRWAALYQKLSVMEDPPVRWGPGAPSDLAPFPSARDPRHRERDGGAAFDYLLPGRMLVLTFAPSRFQSELEAQLQFRDLLYEARDRYRPHVEAIVEWVQALERWRSRD